MLHRRIDGPELRKLTQRVTLLEEAVFKKIKRLRGTEAQRFLIFFHLGLFEGVQTLPVPQNQKDLMVSVMLDIDPDNAKKFLVESSKKKKPLLETITNYTFLVTFFEKVKNEKALKTTEVILRRLQADKDL